MNEKTPHQTMSSERHDPPTTEAALDAKFGHVNALGITLYILAAVMIALQITRFVLWVKK